MLRLLWYALNRRGAEFCTLVADLPRLHEFEDYRQVINVLVYQAMGGLARPNWVGETR